MKMTGEEALKKLEDRIAKQNEYNKANYDRLGTTFKKGTAGRIKELGYTLSGFLKMAVYEKLEEMEGGTQAPSEPPKQPCTATKIEQTENVPTKEEKPLEKAMPSYSVKVDVDGKEVELVLDRLKQPFYRGDLEQLTAYQIWRGKQLKTDGKKEDVLNWLDEKKTLENLTGKSLTDEEWERIKEKAGGEETHV